MTALRFNRWRFYADAVEMKERLTVLAASLVLLSACSASIGGSTPTQAPVTSIVVQRPMSIDELDIVLDPSGRPYDAGDPERWADRVWREPVMQIVAPRGEVLFMDGNSIEVSPSFFIDEATSVVFDVETLEVDAMYEQDGEFQSVLGIVVSIPGTTVDHWGAFEYGYGTGGGVGGLTTRSVVERDEDKRFGSVVSGIDYELQLQTFDADDAPGDETLIFSNGVGDGGFPMSRGFDAEGRLVSAYVFDTRYPWRLAMPAGTPPPTVTERENELAACLAGTRPVISYGFDRWTCQSDADS